MVFNNENTTESIGTNASPEHVRSAWDESTTPSTAVVEAVAAAKGRDPLRMPPLYEFFDVEALDGLLTGDHSGALDTVTVSFTYDGVYVWVSSEGTVEVDPEAASLR